MYRHYRAVLSSLLSKRREDRYVIVDTQTGEIVDDCQGYGYRTSRRAYACFGYKYTKMKQGEAFT
ncbi:hypothetical protein ENFAE_15000 [Enterococcus faecalis]|uniref:hypothetical protein n=1 Tax=Enterococcus faecalis TaxID=1351 RepID=UPI00087856E4|nr:hypothetical protein [Enterococcus faecalis]EKZ0433753.1 hypothetical protein [Enterococcus faecalis]OFA13264.1 hypothetical protein ENFAE_15000 [Enterococcus faecalis]